MSLIINIPKDYTKSPGGRFISEGDFSGEEFRETILLPKYEKAIHDKDSLIVELDGGFGYGPSFLEESFRGLARKLQDNRILKTIKIISDEEPQLIEDIQRYMKDALVNNK